MQAALNHILFTYHYTHDERSVDTPWAKFFYDSAQLCAQMGFLCAKV